MCLLNAHKFVKETLQMYKVTKQIQLSRYTARLAGDGMTYFMVYVHFFPMSFVACLVYLLMTHHYH